MDTRQLTLEQIRSHLYSDETHDKFDWIQDIQKHVYETAVANGWHDKPRALAEPLLLLVTEVAEVYEEIRNNGLMIGLNFQPADQSKGETMDKPIGIDSELADIFIRLLDLCGEWSVDLAIAVKTKMIYNTTRPYRHGGKTA